MNLTIALTHNCQLRCDYCYAGEKHHKAISKETIAQAIAFTFEIPMQKLEFGLFGGEPLMEWELFQWATLHVEAEAKKRAVKLIKTVTTNGVLLSEDRVKWLREHAFYVVVSLDGNEAMHNTHRKHANQRGSFHEVLKGIQTLQTLYNDGEYTIISVATPQNIHHLNDAVKYLYEELKIQEIHLALNYYGRWAEDEKSIEAYRAIYHALGDYVIEQYRQGKEITIDIIDGKIKAQIAGGCASCSFGELKIAVAPSGNIYPCERLIGEDEGDLAIGNVHSGFDHSKRASLIAQRGNSNKECQDCPLKERCTNSCGCTNYTLTGSINSVNGVICFFQKLFIEVADRVASTLYQEKNEIFLGKFYGISN